MSFNLFRCHLSIADIQDMPHVVDPKPQAAHRAGVPPGCLTPGIRRKKQYPYNKLIPNFFGHFKFNQSTHPYTPFDEFSVWQRFSVMLFFNF